MRDSLISILWGVALLGKIQGRCDGAGSEVIGGKPSVNRACGVPSEGFAFGFDILITWVESRSGGLE